MKRILFVDDESKILDGIRRILHADRKRWEMEFVVSGEAALQACEAQPFDVVITDMRMPGMDGVTLLGHLQDRYPSMARIILSGYSEVALATRAAHVAHRFLYKPCNISELQAAIERVCTLQDLLCAQAIREVIGTIGELPSLSSTYNSLTQTVTNPNASIAEVAGILEHDIAMSAKVLQLVNSAFFGLAQKVASVQSAASYLGMETIKNLALASETFRVFAAASHVPESAYESIQAHAQRTVSIAGLLPVDRGSRDILVVSALLHDIGELVLANKMPEVFCAARSTAKEEGSKSFEAEERLLGISHAEIGAYLLGLWGIDNLVVEAIAHHHHPTRIPHAGFDCSVAVYVADLLAHELEDCPDNADRRELDSSDQACLESLGALQLFTETRERAFQLLKSDQSPHEQVRCAL